MTTNDMELEEYTRQLLRNAATIDALTRDSHLDALLTAFAIIEDAARKAGWRVLKLRGDKKVAEATPYNLAGETPAAPPK